MPAREDLWPAILEQIQRTVRPQQFDTWFRSVQLGGYSAESMTLQVPNSFYHEWLRRHYLETIQEAVLQVTGRRPAVEFVVRPVPASEETPAAEPLPRRRERRPAAPSPMSPRARDYYPTDWMSRLNRYYVFDNFVVGASNALPHAAALAIAENPGHAYNPFFLHGGVGLGKTHLMQAITHRLLDNGPEMRMLFLSCESFMNHFISAVQHGETERFRRIFRGLDAMFVDDVHFLARGTKEATQEEFFHTFNALYNAGKQIVLSSDCPPQELTRLEERLLSRFKWGLVARIDAPGFETRVAILRHKAQLHGRVLPDDVLQFIAEHIDTNIRDLECAITKIVAFASLVNKPIDLDLAQQALRDTVHHAATALTLDDVVRPVTQEFRVKLSDLQSKRRTKSITYPRQIAMYLARTLTRHSLQEIGRYFGGRDHTTVMHACDKIERLRKEDPSVDATLDRLADQLRRRRDRHDG